MMAQALNQTQNPEASLDVFQHYAAESLQNHEQEVREALTRRHIPLINVQSLGEAYKISLKLGDDISLKSIQKTVLQQIDAAAYFIRDFQIAVLGQRTSVFHLYEVEIQIERNIKYSLRFESGKLLIQLPYWQVSFLNRHLSYQELITEWNRGKHLSKGSPVRQLWWLFNPIGELRSNLRAMLLLAVQKRILGIDQLFVKFGPLDVGEYPKADVMGSQNFKDSAIAFLKQTVDEDKLGLNLDLVLKNQDETTLAQLLGLFKKNLADPGQMEELIDAGTLTLQEVIHEEQSQVGIKMYGFVNVGNYHRIDVALNLSSGYLKKYVELVPRKAEVKAVLFGFVNVYTIDDITVKPNFHGAMKLNFEAAALERALREIQLTN